ncbi:HAMP domain-containing sensor histidine kinase [Acidaminobacter sp. JC074]|uniref:sensor histidine kinase n=1 Tax=Acidaminobacter sp. JC074 TaxID=2530199 RepID=UPI001F0D6435|nr:HAMP domain-containing sensor histidine kinase [Acidaminobacter sp. JC074]
MKKVLLLGIIIIFLLNIYDASYSSTELIDVLLLNSYHDGYQWSNDTKQGVKDIFDQSDFEYHMRIEHMDTKNISSDIYFEELVNLYKYKFDPNEFDIIICADDNALKFLLLYKEEIFGDTPVFFSGVNTLTTHDLSQAYDFYGVVEKHSIKQTVQVALNLNPQLKDVYLVVDDSITGRATKRDARSDMIALESKVNFHIYDDLSFDEILNEVSQLNPAESIVIQSFYVVDSDGSTYPLEYTAAKLVEFSSAPVYGIFSFGFGQGTVGGKFVEGYTQGSRVAEMVVSFLEEGQVLGERYIIDESFNRYYFDYNVLREYGYDIDNLPEDYIIINKPVSFYQKHQEVINIFLVVVLLLIVYVYLLRRQIRKQTKKISTTQKHLMESEKMASLGRLVAGIAHEVNTPIGIGVSLSSYMNAQTDKVMASFEESKLSKSKLSSYLDDMNTSSELMGKTMIRASELIQSFKQVAVDQTYDQKRKVELCAYMNEIVHSLTSELKHKNIDVKVNCKTSFTIMGHSGAFYQILLNLIMNSITHGFHDKETGKIEIIVDKDKTYYDNNGIHISYRDNGHGMERETLQNIFEPFYTTRRDDGGSGLGMHIVYNLVTQKLKGRIFCTSQLGEYTEFNIYFPADYDESL